VITAHLATKHDKVRLIAPAFLEHPGWDIREVSVDTDVWGTFTPEIPRTLSPGEAALTKARHALEVSGGEVGLGSEGTVGPHPHYPLVTSITEHIALIDRSSGLEVVHRYTSTDIVAFHAVWREGTDLLELARLADLPHHGVIVRVDGEPRSAVKGIRDINELGDVVARLQLHSSGRQVVVESDFRAMMSPSRQRAITACAEEFASRLSQVCPSCDAHYWGVVDVVRGVPCGGCGGWNAGIVAADVWGCWRCGERETVSRGVTQADPARCDSCNP
jgi:hypothetical protein